MGDAARRRRAAATVLVGVLVLVVVAVGLLGFRRAPAARDDPAPGPDASSTYPVPEGRVHPGTWTRIASPPLSSRRGAIGGWTGAEVLLVGGGTAGPCLDRCPVTGQRADGAAYDVTTGRWRRMATAPEPIGPGALAATVGDTMIVETHGDWLAYDAGRDGHGRGDGVFAWRRLPSPGLRAVAVSTGVGGLFAVDGRHRVAFLDLVANRWRELPTPPASPLLGEALLVGYDDGVALVGSDGPDVAVRSLPILVWDGVSWRSRLVPGPGRLDPQTGDWDVLPAPPPTGRPGSVGLAAGDGRPTTSGSGYVWDPLLLTWVGLGRPASLGPGATDVYAGRDVYLVAAHPAGGSAPLSAWVWTP